MMLTILRLIDIQPKCKIDPEIVKGCSHGAIVTVIFSA